MSYVTKIIRKAAELIVASGGKLTVQSGGTADIEAGGVLKIAGTTLTPSAAELNALHGQGAVAADFAKLHAITPAAAAINALVQGLAAGYKVARGQHETVAASDTVVTGLATVVAAIAFLDDDPGLDPLLVTCSIGDQNGAPAAGSVLVKSWKATAANDCTPIAATTFTKKVNWIAIGT